MAKIDLGEIKARAEAATAARPGVWDAVEGTVWAGDCAIVCEAGHFDNDGCVTDNDRVIMAFIAHTRTDIPALVAEVERLHEALEEIQRVVTRQYPSCDAVTDRRMKTDKLRQIAQLTSEGLE
jgi:hypothetical protein